jgi:ribosomal protein S18 acetylase RimI-like enzyme
MNKETFLIKELETSDSFPELLELSKDFFYEYENNNKDFFEIDSIDEVDIGNYFQKFIGNENAKAYIVIIEKKIIGYITLVIKSQPNYWKIKRIGDISGLMVSKNFRHNGIGTKLIMKGIEYFKQKDIKYYTVFTSMNNISGISLYKKCGFEQLYTTLYGRIE